MNRLIRLLLVLALVAIPHLQATAQSDSETAGRMLEPVTMDMSAAEMMRSQ
ncbi:MAG: hypothetical protein R2855_01540 [Thermomicrobiales bacterium]